MDKTDKKRLKESGRFLLFLKKKKKKYSNL